MRSHRPQHKTTCSFIQTNARNQISKKQLDLDITEMWSLVICVFVSVCVGVLVHALVFVCTHSWSLSFNLKTSPSLAPLK